jgi:hypothetical protein
MLLCAPAHSQCEVKIYQDMLVVSSGPSCLSGSDGKQKMASGVKGVVNELNEVSRPGPGSERAATAGERHQSTRDKLYRLAEFEQRDRMMNEARVQSELRQNNRFARKQLGME